MARQHLIHDAAETVDIRPPVDARLRSRLLGAHVDGCADGDARRGQPLAARLRDRPRDPKIHHDCALSHEQDVLGLDIAVHHVVRMGVAERFRHIGRDEQRILEG